MSTLFEIHAKTAAELLQAARDGSSEAFGEIVRRHQQQVRGFLARFLFDQSIVDDIAQEVFISAATGIQTLQSDQSVKAWLLSIARFKAIDYLRIKSRWQTSTVDDIEQLVAAGNLHRISQTKEAYDDRSEALMALHECIQQLKPKSRELIIDHYFEQKPADVIAQQLQRKAGTIRMALLRIRKSLAKCITARVGPEFEL